MKIDPGLIVAFLAVALPVGAGFLAWLVRSLMAVSQNNAVAAEKLAALDDRTTRLEDVVFKPAWDNQTKR